MTTVEHLSITQLEEALQRKKEAATGPSQFLLSPAALPAPSSAQSQSTTLPTASQPAPPLTSKRTRDRLKKPPENDIIRRCMLDRCSEADYDIYKARIVHKGTVPTRTAQTKPDGTEDTRQWNFQFSWKCNRVSQTGNSRGREVESGKEEAMTLSLFDFSAVAFACCRRDHGQAGAADSKSHSNWLCDEADGEHLSQPEEKDRCQPAAVGSDHPRSQDSQAANASRSQLEAGRARARDSCSWLLHDCLLSFFSAENDWPSEDLGEACCWRVHLPFLPTR